MATATPIKTEKPLWTEEGPTYYYEAFAYHKPWATTPPYQTPLTAPDETAFETWVTTYDVPFDIAGNPVDYDMRGYWVARVKGTSVGYTTGEHFPDIWKTPYDTAFSAESIYARDGCPYQWQGDKLYDESNGLLLFWAGYQPPSNTAVGFMQKSKVDPRAQTKGLMGDDLDLQNFRLYLAGKLRLKAYDQVTDANVTRTIDGASSLSVTLDDSDREVLRSGLLSNKLDLQVDGLWFKLAKVEKDNQDSLTLTFETREISYLRNYTSFIQQKRDDYHTRARFILRMIKEVGQVNIPVVIPDLKIVQPLEASGQPTNADGSATQSPDTAGIPADTGNAADPNALPKDPRKNLMVKTEKASADQINNANLILNEGTRLRCSRKILVCSIMTAIQENSITADPGEIFQGRLINVGIFQQDAKWGWPATNDATIDSNAFFRSAITEDRKNPSQSYNDLCQAVQGSGYPDAYGQWKGQAENWVTAYALATGKEIPATTVPTPLVPGPTTPAARAAAKANQRPDTSGASSGDGTTFFFYRGIPGSTKDTWGKEDSWTAIQRLADDVHWRAFFVAGTFWYVNDTQLFHMKPIMTVTESSAGIDSIAFDYDNGKKTATVTLKVRIGRWIAQPGAVVVLEDMGPINGKWLVNEFTRSLFDLTATVVLKKPLPELPEPLTEAFPGAPDVAPVPPTPSVLNSIVIPIHHVHVAHPPDGDTANLPGYKAVDFIMDSSGATVPGASNSAMGQQVTFEEGGTVRRVHLIPWTTGFGGITFYMLGDSGNDYFITHLDESSPVKEGRLEARTVFGYLTKSIIHSGEINGAHVHVGCTGYT